MGHLRPEATERSGEAGRHRADRDKVPTECPFHMLLGARTLLGAPGLTTSNKKLLGTKGIATNRARTLVGWRPSLHLKRSCLFLSEAIAHGHLDSCLFSKVAQNLCAAPVATSYIHASVSVLLVDTNTHNVTEGLEGLSLVSFVRPQNQET